MIVALAFKAIATIIQLYEDLHKDLKEMAIGVIAKRTI
jgi:hypothetical protein